MLGLIEKHTFIGFITYLVFLSIHIDGAGENVFSTILKYK